MELQSLIDSKILLHKDDCSLTLDTLITSPTLELKGKAFLNASITAVGFFRVNQELKSNEKQNRNGGANFGRSYNGAGSLDKDIRGRRRNNAHN